MKLKKIFYNKRPKLRLAQRPSAEVVVLQTDYKIKKQNIDLII